MTLNQMQSLNRRWPSEYESWAQHSGQIKFIELRGSTEYPLTHHPHGDQTYSACGTEYLSTQTRSDLTTYVR